MASLQSSPSAPAVLLALRLASCASTSAGSGSLKVDQEVRDRGFAAQGITDDTTPESHPRRSEERRDGKA